MSEQQRLETRVKSVLEDPSAQAVARVYADAFLDAAQSVGVEGALEEFASFVDDVLEANPEFESLLTSALIGRDQKLDIIDRIVSRHGSELFTNFLRVLAKHERLDLLPVILSQTQERHLARTGRQRVKITTARALSDRTLERIRSRLDELLPVVPILDVHVDPELLGGLVIQVGDTVYDSSMRIRLKLLRERLRQRSLHEIQSGRDRFSHSEGN